MWTPGSATLTLSIVFRSASVERPFRPPQAPDQERSLVVDLVASIRRRSCGAALDTPESEKRESQRSQASHSCDIRTPLAFFVLMVETQPCSRFGLFRETRGCLQLPFSVVRFRVEAPHARPTGGPARLRFVRVRQA